MKLYQENSKKNKTAKYLKLDNQSLKKIKLSNGLLSISTTLMTLGLVGGIGVFCNNLLSEGDLNVPQTIAALISTSINAAILERLGVKIWNNKKLIKEFDKFVDLENQYKELETILDNNKNENVVYYPQI